MDEEKVDKVPAVKKKRVRLVQFRENRTFDLHLRHEVIQFPPYGERAMTEEEMSDSGFIQAAKYFTIKEG